MFSLDIELDVALTMETRMLHGVPRSANFFHFTGGVE